MDSAFGPQRGSMRVRAAWIIADQAVSSIANAGLTIVVARSVSQQQYGAYALAFTIYTFAVALTQSISGQVVIIGYSHVPYREHQLVSARAAGTALGAGFAGMVVLWGISPFVSATTGPILLLMSLLLPALVLQDLWRTVFVARGTPRSAFLNDSIWTLLQIAIIAVLLVARVHSVVPYLLAWGVSAVVAAAAGCFQNGVTPQLRGAFRWLRDNRKVSVPTLGNAFTNIGALQVAFLLIAGVGSVAALGSIRASQTLLGPLNIVGFAATAFAVPELARHRLSRRSLLRAGMALSVMLVVVDALWGGTLLLLPDTAGRSLLGATWSGSRSALPGMIITTCGIGAMAGASVVMRAISRPDLVLWTSVILGPLVIVLSLVGVSIDGARGAAFGIALAALLSVPPTWALLLRGLDKFDRQKDTVAGSAGTDL